MKKTKILLVDDDEQLLAGLRMGLKAHSRIDVLTESDPMRAVPVASQFRPDIIILDVVMQGMDGGDLASSLRTNELTKDTPVMFMTTLLTRTETRWRQDANTEEYMVSKPVSVADLVRHIETRLGRKT